MRGLDRVRVCPVVPSVGPDLHDAERPGCVDLGPRLSEAADAMAWIKRHALPVSILGAVVLLVLVLLALFVFFGAGSGEGGLTVTTAP